MRRAAGSEPTSGSVIAYEPSTSPEASCGRKRPFCSSLPAIRIGSAVSFTYAAISDAVPETFASSSMYALNSTLFALPPPYSSGTARPMKPSSASARCTSIG